MRSGGRGTIPRSVRPSHAPSPRALTLGVRGDDRLPGWVATRGVVRDRPTFGARPLREGWAPGSGEVRCPSTAPTVGVVGCSGWHARRGVEIVVMLAATPHNNALNPTVRPVTRLAGSWSKAGDQVSRQGARPSRPAG